MTIHKVSIDAVLVSLHNIFPIQQDGDRAEN